MYMSNLVFTFIMYAQGQKIGKPNNVIVFGSKHKNVDIKLSANDAFLE
jgi:hypothetical protein